MQDVDDQNPPATLTNTPTGRPSRAIRTKVIGKNGAAPASSDVTCGNHHPAVDPQRGKAVGLPRAKVGVRPDRDITQTDKGPVTQRKTACPQPT